MNSNYYVRFWGLALLLCAAAMLVPGTVWAQADPRYWPDQVDPEPGIPIRQGHHIEWQRASYRSSAGSTEGQILVAWSDTRYGDRDVFAQVINPDGSLVFEEEDGKLISRALSRQEDPEPVAVDDGWIIAWIDYRADSTGDVYAKKIDINGQTWTGWDENGNVVDVLPNSMVGEVTVRAVHDGNGGAIIAWEDFRSGQGGDIYAQHINSDGTTSWTEPLAVTQITGAQSGITADTDGNGNMVVAWNDNRSGVSDVYAAKITPAGELPWGDGQNGILACTAAGNQSAVKLCSDLETGGCYLAWVDTRDGIGHEDLYMQRIDGSGNLTWAASGLVLCNAPDKQLKVRVSTDLTSTGQVGVLTVWEDIRVNGYVNEVYAQKTSASGVHQWTANGVLVCGNAGPSSTGESRDGARLTSDMAGGSIVVWDDTRDSQNDILFYDLYAERISSAGDYVWSDNGCGTLVCSGESAQWKGVLRMISNDVVCVLYDDESRGSQTLRYRRLNVSNGEGIDPGCGQEFVYGLDGDATNPHSIEMDPGTVAVVWEDNRGGNLGKAIFYQAIDTSKALMLPANGDTLCPDNEGHLFYDQSAVDLASDGDHGFFVSFIDNRSGTTQVRLTRVNRNAEPVCSRAGEIIHESIYDQQESLVCEDGNGGCYVAWQGNDLTFTLDIYIHHYDENCDPVWTEPIRLTDDGTVDDVLTALVPSSNNCCFVVWESGDPEQLDVHGARVCSDGTVSWQDVICDAPDVQTDVVATPDNAGGLFVAWADKRTASMNQDIYAQRLNSAGEAQWQDNGVVVISLENLQNHPIIVADEDNYLYVFWEDFRNGSDLNIFGQKLDSNGNRMWTGSGNFGENISDEPGDQNEMALMVDPCNGLYASWTDNRGIHSDIFGTHLSPDNEFTYFHEWWSGAADGAICRAYQNQSQPTLSHDGATGEICTWVDWRASGKDPLQNIWANWIADHACTTYVALVGPSLVQEYALSQNYPNPFNPSTEFEFSIPKQERVEISIYNTLGQQVMSVVDEVMAAGTYRVTVDAGRLTSGVYFYQMTTPSFRQVHKMTLVR